MHPDLVSWIARFFIFHYDYNDSPTTVHLCRMQFQDDNYGDDNTDNTKNRDNFTDLVRYYGEFRNTFVADDKAKR